MDKPSSPGESASPKVSARFAAGRRARLARRFKLLAIFLAILAGLAFSVKPAYRAFRDHRVQSNLEAARIAAREGRWEDARDLSRSVMLLWPTNFEALKIFSSALGNMREPTAYPAALRILTEPRSTREDQLESFRTIVQQGPQALSFSAHRYVTVEKHYNKDPEFVAAFAPFLLLRNQPAEAERQLREVLTDSPPPTLLLELIRVLCAYPNPPRIAEAQGYFCKLINAGADTEALNALELLAQVSNGLRFQQNMPDLQQWIGTVSEARVKHHLMVMEAGWPAKPADIDQLTPLLAGYLTADPAAVGWFLTTHGFGKATVDLLAESAATDGQAFLCRVNALMLLDRLDEAEQCLTAPPSSTNMIEVELTTARLARQRELKVTAKDPVLLTRLGKTKAAALNRALEHAIWSRPANECLKVRRLAALLKSEDAELNALVASVRLGWGPIPRYDDVRGSYARLRKKDRFEDILAILRVFIQSEAENPEVVLDYIYMGMLQGTIQPADAVSRMSALSAHIEQKLPDMSEEDREGKTHRGRAFNLARLQLPAALAFAHLMAGDPDQCLALLPQIDGEQLKTALQGTAEIQKGDKTTGENRLKGVPWQNFMQKEVAALEKIWIDAAITLRAPRIVETEVPEATDKDLWRVAVEQLERNRPVEKLPTLDLAPLLASPDGEDE